MRCIMSCENGIDHTAICSTLKLAWLTMFGSLRQRLSGILWTRNPTITLHGHHFLSRKILPELAADSSLYLMAFNGANCANCASTAMRYSTWIIQSDTSLSRTLSLNSFCRNWSNHLATFIPSTAATLQQLLCLLHTAIGSNPFRNHSPTRYRKYSIAWLMWPPLEDMWLRVSGRSPYYQSSY